MAESTTTSHSHSNLLPNVSHIKKLDEPDDYVEWSQDVQSTLISGGWWKFVCSQPEFPTSDPDYIPYPDPLLSAPAPLPLDVVDIDEPTARKTRAATAAAATTAAAAASNVKLMAEHREWTKGDNAARHVIRATIAQHIKTSLPPVVTPTGITHARDYWNLLKSDYDTVSYNDTTDLEARLGLLRMSDSAVNYVSEIRHIQSILLGRGDGCSNTSLINHLLRGLPDDRRWKEWRRTEMAGWKSSKGSVTFNEVARAIITQASSFEIRDAIDQGHVIFCNKSGTKTRSPTKTSKSSPPSSPKSSHHKTICTYCDNYGHLEPDCRKKKRDEENKKGEGGTNRGGGHNSGKSKERAQVTTDTTNTKHVTESVSLTNEDFSDYCIVASKSPLPCFVPSQNVELSAITLTHTSFRSNSDFASIVLDRNTTIFDSGCTSHIFKNRDVFHTYVIDQATNVSTANCGVLSTLARGDVHVLFRFRGQTRRMVLKGCLHVPDTAVNLLSQGRFDEEGYFITTGSNKAILFRPPTSSLERDIWTEAPRIGYLYWPVIEFIPLSSNLNIDLDPSPSVLDSLDAIPDTAAYLHVPLTAELWHARLGHAGKDYTSVMLSGRYATGITSTTKTMTSHCESCIIGKHPREPYPYRGNRAENPLDLIHIDICGPFPVPTPDKFHYFIAYLDDNTNLSHIDLLKKKSEALASWIALCTRWERLTGRTVARIRTDNAREFLSRLFQAYLVQRGIEHDTSCPYAHQQNGKAERFIRTVEDGAVTMLVHSNLPLWFWGKAVLARGYIHNRLPSKSLPKDKTPYELFRLRKPDVSHLRVWGSQCWAGVPSEKRSKGGPKAIECIFMGYPPGVKGYCLWDPKKRTFFNCSDVVFNENRPNLVLTYPEQDYPDEGGDGPLPSDGNTRPTRVVPIPFTPPTRPKRIPVMTERGQDWHDGIVARDKWVASVCKRRERRMEVVRTADVSEMVSLAGTSLEVMLLASCRMMNDPELDSFDHYAESSCIIQELILHSHPRARGPIPADIDLNQPPRSRREIEIRLDKTVWTEAMQAEVDNLESHGTYRVAPLPIGRRAIRPKWVFIWKRDKDGNPIKAKARLVIMGCEQEEGVDYGATFAPTVKISTVRLVLAEAAREDLELNVWDVVGAFLNPVLEQEIYMRPIPGFPLKDPTSVLLLLKTLYGLKQASREWYGQIRKFLESIGFICCPVDEGLFIITLHTPPDSSVPMPIFGFIRCYVCLHVDDGLTACNSLPYLTYLKRKIREKWEIKDLGDIDLYLGMKVTRNRSTREIWISQQYYTESLIERWGMDDANPVYTPMEDHLWKLKDAPLNALPELSKLPRPKFIKQYQAIVGGLLYLAICTRPDISYSVQALSQHNMNPSLTHLLAAKRLIRYLIATKSYSLCFGGDRRHEPLMGYSDADWANEPDRISLSGYLWTYAGGLISWCSRKQRTIACSSTEGEYMAVSLCVQEGLWLKSLFTQLCIPLHLPFLIKCDNKGTIFLADGQGASTRSKHIDIKYHFIREHTSKKTFDIIYVPTADQTADIFTKPLGRTLHEKHVKSLALASC